MFYVAARTCTVQCVSFVSLHRTSYKFLSYGSPKPPNAFRRAVALIKSFAIGTKDLFYDIKNIFKLQRRSGMLKLTDAAPKRVGPGKSNFPFSRRELQFIYRTTRDIQKVLPTVTLFMIPLLGYAVPVIAYLFPKYLLSHHFWTAEQKKSFDQSFLQKRLKYFESVSAEDVVKASASMQLVKEQFLQRKRTVTSVQIPNFPNKCQRWLNGGWGLMTWLPQIILKRRLKKHLQYIFLCDWLIKLEGGISSLSSDELSQACCERGLVKGDKGELEMKKLLSSWINITTHYQDCPITLIAVLPTAQI